MKRQIQFETPEDTKKEISRYMVRDIILHLIILITVICGVGLYFSVKYGQRIDVICNKFLK